MIKKLAFLTWLLICAEAAFAESATSVTLSPGKPSEVGMSEAVLEAGVALFEEAVAKDELRGVVLLVARQGKIVLHEALGWRDVEKNQPMHRDSLFRMASNTKPVIASAVLQLAEQGKLSLDDKVSDFLPSFDNKKSRNITIRQLLSHTSGLRIEPIFLKPLLRKSKQHPNAPSLQAEVARFGAIGPKKEPGTSYSYNNPGYNTLGALIEGVTKTPLKAHLQKSIYEPLSMNDSCNHESDADHQRMSVVFKEKKPDGTWETSWKPGDKPDYPFPRASGGMISTAYDYAVFCQTFLNGGDYGSQQLLEEKYVKMATQAETQKLFSPEHQKTQTRYYGLGWGVSTEGFYYHAGSDGTYAWIDPKHQIVGLVFTQSPGGRNPREQFRKVVDAACYLPEEETR